MFWSVSSWILQPCQLHRATSGRICLGAFLCSHILLRKLSSYDSIDSCILVFSVIPVFIISLFVISLSICVISRSSITGEKYAFNSSAYLSVFCLFFVSLFCFFFQTGCIILQELPAHQCVSVLLTKKAHTKHKPGTGEIQTQ